MVSVELAWLVVRKQSSQLSERLDPTKLFGITNVSF